jgi:uncharacterized protein YndB with AHSA1/START domain
MKDAPLDDIEESIVMNVDLERAWRVMTEPDYVVRWLGCLNYSKKVGHVFHMQPDPSRCAAGDIEGATHCEILTLEEPRLFGFSWYLPGTPKTEVMIELMPLGEKKTRASLKHSGWDQFQAREIRQIWEMLAGGWKSAVLPNLKRVAETGE